MSRWEVTWLLARWEFLRYFKWKSQLFSWGFGLTIMLGLAFVAPHLVEKTITETTTVGVLGETPFAMPPTLGIAWRHGGTGELQAAYEAGEVTALLRVEDDSTGELITTSDGGWVHAVQAALDGARQKARLAAHDLDRDVLNDLLDDFELEIVDPDAEDAPDEAAAEEDEPPRKSRRKSKWDKIIALTLMGFMFGGVFTGTALLFSGITSEKQQLVTEQIVAAVPPQTWIDGKILGNGMRSLQSTGEMVLWSLLGMAIWGEYVNPDFQGLSHVSPGFLAQVALLAVLGYGLWFCVFAAISATIDDPNTSARGMFLLLPMVAPALAVPAYLHPDGGLAVVFSMLPPSATLAMTLRLAFTEVPTWQVIVAAAGMALSILFLRRAAGKVFAMAILMRGKEPSWREIWGAARKS